MLSYLHRRRRPPSVSQDYGFALGFIEHLRWLKKPIFEWQSLSHLSHLKIVLGSVTVPMAFLIFRFSTCRMFRVVSACLIPFYTRCCHVERSSTISSQLSTSMATCFISLLAIIFEAKEWAASFTCTLLKLAVEKVIWNPSFSHPA